MAKRMGTRRVLSEKMAAGQGGYITGPKDERTCPDCAGKHGKFSGQTPPFHPNCRCSLSSN